MALGAANLMKTRLSAPVESTAWAVPSTERLGCLSPRIRHYSLKMLVT